MLQASRSPFRDAPAVSRATLRRSQALTGAILSWMPVAMGLLLPLSVFAMLYSLAIADALAASPDSYPETTAASSTIAASANSSPSFFNGFTPEVQRWSDSILRWSASYGLAPELIAVVMQIESCGHPSARSSAGALGLFQVMPLHFQGSEDPMDPEVNAHRGLTYLARALAIAEGDSARALAGYNGGHGLIHLPPRSWPSETHRYVHWGQGILDDMRRGAQPSDTLQAWLDAGGAALCRRAARQFQPGMD